MDDHGVGAARSWFAHGGDMAARIERFDWTQTPLGPLSSWPASLVTAVRLLLASRYPMFLWWGDHLVNLYNDAYVPILGARHPEALGASAPQIWPDVWPVVGPQAHRVLRHGEASWNEELLLVMDRNGFPEETYFTFSYSPAPDDGGGIGGVFCTCTEDTRRVLGQRRLRVLRELSERSARATTVLDACEAAGSVLADEPRDIAFALIYLLEADQDSAHLAAVAGIEPEQTARLRQVAVDDASAAWPLRTDPEGGPTPVADLERRFGHLPRGVWPEPPERAIVLPLLPTGESRPDGFLVIGLSPRLVFDDDYGGFATLLATHVETAITQARAFQQEQRRAQALAELDRAKTTFFSNVSHEFRTPLTLMLGPLEDLLDDREGPLAPEIRSQVERVHRNSVRLLKLVNTMLSFSRVEAGRADARFERTDIAALTRDLASVFRSTVEAGGLFLHVDCPPVTAPVHVDRDLWEKIVLNLVSNAFKFTFEGGITVRLKETASEVQLEVEDTGVGISDAELPRVFERFHRIEGARRRSHEGTGIGLALVDALARVHGGQVQVRSREGQGSTFTVSIPLGADHLPPDRLVTTDAPPRVDDARGYVEEALRWLPPAPSSDGEQDSEVHRGVRGSGPTARPRVLWADDNADLRAYVTELLSPRFDVEAAADGEAALSAARQRRPDLVLADVMMPGLNGFELLAALRADPDLGDVPVILLSARAGEEARLGAAEAGADDYLTKPFSARELVVRVGAQLELASVRREAQRAIAESEQRFRVMAHTAPAMLWMTDPTGACVFLSRGWHTFTGQREEESLGFGWLEAVHPDDRRRSERIFLESNARREAFQLDYRIRRADGAYRWAIDAGAPRFGADGAFEGFSGSVIDVHERKVAEEALREGDRRKDEFLATLAHELRNPLAPIRSAVEILNTLGPEDPSLQRARDVIGRQVGHMVRLIDDLLDLSRLSRGTVVLRRTRVDLRSVVTHAVENARSAVERGGHTLTLRMPETPVWVWGDDVRLVQVVTNLLDNAAKYTPQGGRVTLHVGMDDARAHVSVHDDGRGIAADMAERIFDMFTQGQGSGATGLGIGLSLVRTLVEMHGGAVRVDSPGVGEGSTFTVTLPLDSGHHTPVGEETVDTRQATAAGHRRILVVDDNADAGQTLATLLGLRGHVTQSVADGTDALRVVDSFRPDVVLLDLGMPGMDGLEVARRLRAARQGHDLLLVALTGWGQDEDRRRSRAAGFDAHLVKPVDVTDLEAVLRGAV